MDSFRIGLVRNWMKGCENAPYETLIILILDVNDRLLNFRLD